MPRVSRKPGALSNIVEVAKLFQKTFRVVGRLQVGSTGGGQRPRPSGGYFNPEYWAANSLAVIEAQVEKAGNPGQVAILEGDFLDAANRSCQEQGEDYTADRFIADVRLDLGDSKADAISIITEECGEELYEAWDASYAGDNIGAKLYGITPGPATIAWMQVSASLNNQQIRSRGRATARNFLKKNPGGRPR